MTASEQGPLNLSGRTVFVVGAGASKEFELPLGAELALKIADLLDESFSGCGASGKQTRLVNELMRPPHGLSSDDSVAANQARGGLLAASSIDNFLHDWRDQNAVVRIGKLALAQAINEAERLSPLANLTAGDRDKCLRTLRDIRGAWIALLFARLTEGLRPEETGEAFSKVGFVVFNYDRCVEQYLFHAFHMIRGFHVGLAKELLSKIPIFHPYGIVGNLPVAGDNGGVAFGDDQCALREIVSPIRTFTENIEDLGMLASIREMMRFARQIIFLGFGFHGQNLRILFDGEGRMDCPIYGTSIAVTDRRRREILDYLGDSGDPLFEGIGCSQLLEKWGHVIFERMRAAPENWRPV